MRRPILIPGLPAQLLTSGLRRQGEEQHKACSTVMVLLDESYKVKTYPIEMSNFPNDQPFAT